MQTAPPQREAAPTVRLHFLPSWRLVLGLTALVPLSLVGAFEPTAGLLVLLAALCLVGAFFLEGLRLGRQLGSVVEVERDLSAALSCGTPVLPYRAEIE